jgi:hypothetical protein
MQSVALTAFVVILTSAAGGKIGAGWLGLNWLALGKAGLRTLETVGIGAIFFVANLATGMIVIAAVRGLTGFVVSHYILRDVSLLSLSLLQGVVFAWWHGSSGQTDLSGSATSSRPPRN